MLESTTVLQISDVLEPTQFEAVLLGFQLLKLIIGSVIVAIAYQGYRRTESRPMLFVALGFALVLLVPFVLHVLAVGLIVWVGLPSTVETGVIVASEVSQVAGLGVILYGLRV